jgi:CubicO group peptidase (beta-lactamase class C family)
MVGKVLPAYRRRSDPNPAYAMKHRLKPALAVVALVLSCGLPAARAQAPLPPEFADWDAFMAQQMALWKVPGVSLAIVKDGKVILSRGYGLRDVERQLPMTENSVQPIASTTKSFTVASLATLVRDGKIEWDKPVREYLPDFRLHSDYATQTVTVRDLVTHRTGLPRHDWVWYGSTLSREQIFQRLRHLELSAEPRARFQYNNLMYMTAGYLGGRVAGSDWETLVRNSVLQPLGMSGTGFTVADLKKSPDHATGYRLDDAEVPVAKPYQELVAMGPTGSMNSNARDMGQYLLMLAGGGAYQGKTLIPAADLRAMTTGQMVLPDARLWPERSNPQYGMGWFVTAYRGVTLVDHGGNLEGASTTLGFVPGRGVGVYATVNVSGSALRDVILYAAIDRLLGLPPVDWSTRFREQYVKGRAAEKAARDQKVNAGKPGTRPGFTLDDYVGDYEHPAYGLMRIGREGSALTLSRHGFSTPLPHLHFEVFQAPRNELSELSQVRVMFTSSFDGELLGLQAELEPAVKPIEFKRLPDARLKDRVFLETLAGTYAIGLSEFNVTLRPDGVLTLAGRTGAASELLGLRGTRFEVKGQPGFSVEFLADAAGRYTRLALNRAGGSSVAERVAPR